MKTKTIWKTLIGIFLIGGGVGYFLFQAMQSTWAYYYTVDGLVDDVSVAQDNRVRVFGRVKEDSVVRDIEKMRLTFRLAGSKNELPVEFEGPVPDNFTEGREVVVEGHLDGSGVFEADRLMTKCESKYKAGDD